MDEIREKRDDPGEVGEAQAQVERNRERLSETLDALEERIVETKAAIREKINVLRPVQERVRARPWVALAMAAGVGAAVGAIAGGGSGEDVIDEDERRRRREWRKRRRARMMGGDSDAYRGRIRDEAEPSSQRKRARSKKKSSSSTMRVLRKQLMATVASAVVAGLRERAKKAARGESRPAVRDGGSSNGLRYDEERTTRRTREVHPSGAR